MPSIDSRKQEIVVWFNEGVSQQEMAKRTGFTQTGIGKFLRRNGLVCTPDANWRWLKEFTSEQQSILHGTLLGDGNLNITNSGGVNAHLQLKHSIKQRDWFMWKYTRLRNLFQMEPKTTFDRCGIKGYEHRVYEKIYASSKCHPLLTIIHRQFYPAKKVVTQSILDQVDDLALMVWFCDDGGQSYFPYLCAGGLTASEYDLMEQWLTTQGFEPNRVIYHHENCIRFDIHRGEKLME